MAPQAPCRQSCRSTLYPDESASLLGGSGGITTEEYLERRIDRLTEQLHRRSWLVPAAVWSAFLYMAYFCYFLSRCSTLESAAGLNTTTLVTPSVSNTSTGPALTKSLSHITLPSLSHRTVNGQVERLLVLTGRHNASGDTTTATATAGELTPDPDPPASPLACSLMVLLLALMSTCLAVLLVVTVWATVTAKLLRHRLIVAQRVMRALASGSAELPREEVEAAVEAGDMITADQLIRLHNQTAPTAEARGYYGSMWV